MLTLGTDALLRTLGILPPVDQVAGDPVLLLATAYRTLYGVLGSYLAARLAPSRPIVHALVPGALGLAASIAGIVLMWNHPAVTGHRWYPLALAVLAMPTAWIGGKLFTMQSNAGPAVS